MTRQYRQYTKEFKLEAIRLAEESDQSVSQVARELGIRVNQLYKWKEQLSLKGEDSFPGKGQQSGEAAQLTKLRKENERLRAENEILKKATHHFTKISE